MWPVWLKNSFKFYVILINLSLSELASVANGLPYQEIYSSRWPRAHPSLYRRARSLWGSWSAFPPPVRVQPLLCLLGESQDHGRVRPSLCMLRESQTQGEFRPPGACWENLACPEGFAGIRWYRMAAAPSRQVHLSPVVQPSPKSSHVC